MEWNSTAMRRSARFWKQGRSRVEFWIGSRDLVLLIYLSPCLSTLGSRNGFNYLSRSGQERQRTIRDGMETTSVVSTIGKCLFVSLPTLLHIHSYLPST